jgi:hypothetical protein
MSRLTSITLCAALAACTSDALEDSLLELSVSDLPAPGSISIPAEGYAIYDSWIDAGNQCGNGGMRPGMQQFSDYLQQFNIVANSYAQCGGFHSVNQAHDVWIFGHAGKQAFANWLTANDNEMARRLGIVQIVWNHQMWRSYSGSNGPQGGWGPYNGSNPHTDHLHVSYSEAAAQGATSFFTHVIGGGAPASGGYAFQANTTELWTQGGPTGLGMMPGTSPAIAGAHVAFQANTGELWVDGAPRGLGMMAGTSPSVSADGGVAFQANTSELWVNYAPTGLGMMAGTSPDIAGGNVAFQANTGELWVNFAPTGLGMMSATSPSIADDGTVAFQANTGELWIGGAPTGLGMMAGTSPSIAALSGGGHRWAFQANTGELWIDGAPTGLGMMASTSPSVAPSGNVVFQANTTELWLVDGTGGHPLGLGMATGTSPAN